MLRVNSLKMPVGYTEDGLRTRILKRLRISSNELVSYNLVKRSVDARDKENIRYVLCVDVAVGRPGQDGIDRKLENKILSDRKIKDVSPTEPVIYKDPGRNINNTKPMNLPDGDVDRNTNGSYLQNNTDMVYDQKKRPVITGFGPAGMICAYKLDEAGLKPVVIERGLDVDRRISKVGSFWKGDELDENTNVQFGEGGAGTFSDGKLSTMIHDKVGRIGEFFRILVENGADESILYNSKPHVGTDRLAVIVKNIRKRIIELGGEIYFGYRLSDIICDKDNSIREIVAVNMYPDGSPINIVKDKSGPYGNLLNEMKDKSRPDEIRIETDALVLAIGHSARDTFEMLHSKGFMMEQKAFAVGVRVQHPQVMIGMAQYGREFTKLPPADYKLTYQSERLNRGVYSFCMCPGGFVVNSSSEKGRLVVNGMSNSDRSEETANSAIVVNVDSRDFDGADWNAGIEFQRRLEKRAYDECAGKIPVQRYEEFAERALKSPAINDTGCVEDTGNKANKKLHQTEIVSDRGSFQKDIAFEKESFQSDIVSCRKSPILQPNTKGLWAFGNVYDILPSAVSEAIAEAFPDFGRKIRGFDDPDTLFMGVESRTSSSVRITRNETLEAVGFSGIYPCGEGAGYAGGITSAAVDGIKVYEAILQR